MKIDKKGGNEDKVGPEYPGEGAIINIKLAGLIAETSETSRRQSSFSSHLISKVVLFFSNRNNLLLLTDLSQVNQLNNYFSY